MLDFASDISRFSTSARKNGQPRKSARSSPTGTAPSPVPAPSQAGTMQRVCVHENTHGIARRASSSPVPDASGRDAGRDPISRRVSSSSGVNVRRNRGRSGSSHTTDRYRAPAARETASIVSRAPSGASAIRSGTAVRSVAATAASRFRRARPGRPYLNAIVSPCSVTLRRPSTACGGCARIAAYVGPPPRPALPPRPWKTVSSTPRSPASQASRSCARKISHCAVTTPPSLPESE